MTKLGEYVAKQSSPARRRQIIQAQKVPPTFQTVTYTPASKLIIDHILAGSEEEFLLEAIGEFFQKAEEAVSDFDKTQAKCCRDALSAFRKVASKIDLEGCTPKRGPVTWSIQIGGVDVSVRPELFLELPGRGGRKKVGFVKFYFSKAYRLDDHSAGVIAAVTIAKAEQCISAETKISHKHVIVVDVFGQQVFVAPTSTKRLFNEAQAACEEIAFHWERFSAS